MLSLANEKRLDGCNIAVGRGLNPLAKLARIEPGRWNAFAPKKGCVSVLNKLSLVNHYDHSSASESVVAFPLCNGYESGESRTTAGSEWHELTIA
jgi:hypothetical protein